MNYQFSDSLDLTSVVGEYVVHSLIDIVKDSLQKHLPNIIGKNNNLEKIIEDALYFEIKKTINWASEIRMSDFNISKSLDETYLELNIYSNPIRNEFINDGGPNKKTLTDILCQCNDHLILLGHPGSGKTTLMKNLCYSILQNNDFTYKSHKYPFVIRFRDIINELNEHIEISHRICLYKLIFTRLGLNLLDIFEVDKKKERLIVEHNTIEHIKRTIVSVLDKFNFLLILDGYDEIPNSEFKKIILSEIRELSLSLNEARIITTSRLGELDVNIHYTKSVEVCPLDDNQRNEFLKKWITDKEEQKIFNHAIVNSPYLDSLSRPLMLAHLCMIFIRYKKIPDKPKYIYEKVVRLLIEEWNAQNSIFRNSLYSTFDTERKLEFLKVLAYRLTVYYRLNKFDTVQLQMVYKEVCADFGLPKDDSLKVVSEMESHNGLLIRAGYSSFEFAHKSIQEYLVAEYIAKMSKLPQTIFQLPNEAAIVIALSSEPTEQLIELFSLPELPKKGLKSFVKPLIIRLSIEKCDFSVKPKSAAVLLSLLQEFQKHRVDKNGNVTIVSEDDLNSELDVLKSFESLFGTTQMKTSFNKLLDYYEKIENNNTFENYHVFKRNKNLDKLKQALNLPYLLVEQKIYIIITLPDIF